LLGDFIAGEVDLETYIETIYDVTACSQTYELSFLTTEDELTFSDNANGRPMLLTYAPLETGLANFEVTLQVKLLAVDGSGGLTILDVKEYTMRFSNFKCS